MFFPLKCVYPYNGYFEVLICQIQHLGTIETARIDCFFLRIGHTSLFLFLSPKSFVEVLQFRYSIVATLFWFLLLVYFVVAVVVLFTSLPEIHLQRPSLPHCVAAAVRSALLFVCFLVVTCKPGFPKGHPSGSQLCVQPETDQRLTSSQ